MPDAVEVASVGRDSAMSRKTSAKRIFGTAFLCAASEQP
jgi:hypothetical protein